MKKLIMFATSAAFLSTLAALPAISYAQLTANLRGDTDLSAENRAVRLENSVDINPTSTARPFRVNLSGVAITSASQVNSEEDLEVFSANAAIKGLLVSKVDTNSTEKEESKVRVKYQHEGKLFGFIPVTIPSTTTVEVTADGDELEIRSIMAWWGLFVSGINHSRSEIESQVRNSVAVQVNAKAGATAQAKASVAEAVIAELQSHSGARVTATAGTAQ